MVTKVQRWGNSLGVRLPKSAAEEAQLSNGSPVDVRSKDGIIVVRPIRAKGFNLARMVARIHPGNVHHEFDMGAAKGRELW